MDVVFVTGMSGSGIGSSVRIFDDLGFCAIDNLPLSLISSTIDHFVSKEHDSEKLAFGIHFSSKKDISIFFEAMKSLQNTNNIRVIYLDCNDEALVSRYKLSRRPHPFCKMNLTMIEAVQCQRKELEAVKKLAEVSVDTTYFTLKNLKSFVEAQFEDLGKKRLMSLNLISFGFKHGALSAVDNLFDVRFLPNPYYVKNLRSLSGKDEKVINYLRDNESVSLFFERLKAWLCWIIPQYYQEGRHYLHVGIGCSGGQHRSVYFVEELEKYLLSHFDVDLIVTKSHRDLSNPF